MEEIVLVDLFSGIGGFAKGLMDGGMRITKHYFSEIDKHAIANYKYNFPDAEYIGSIIHVSGERIRAAHPSAKIIITFGWPCQDNSIAGKRKGQRKGTRSGLLFEAGRIIFESKCELFLAENVKGLYSVNEGIDFYESIRFLTYLDTDNPQYTVEMQLFNTDWILPQNRERTYFIGHIGGRSFTRVFPIQKNMQQTFKEQQQTTNTITTRYYQSQAGGGYIIEDKQLLINSATEEGFEIAIEGDSINYSVLSSKTRRGRVGKQKAQTIDTAVNQGVFTKGIIRRFTEIECERLQGFPDNWTMWGNYDEVVKAIPRNQRYRLCGNAVTKKLIELISNQI
jgi:DNA (cytosine-5)-methyltransferase 1